MNCKFVKKQIIKYVDNEIKDYEIEICKPHIKECVSCNKFFNDTMKIENMIKNINVPISEKNFFDFEKLIPEKRIVSHIPYWLIAATILFAAIVGSTLGTFNVTESNDLNLTEYSGNNITYISMVDNLE